MLSPVGRPDWSTYNLAGRIGNGHIANRAPVGRLAESTTKPNQLATVGRDGVSTYTLTAIVESLEKYTATLSRAKVVANRAPWVDWSIAR